MSRSVLMEFKNMNLEKLNTDQEIQNWIKEHKGIDKIEKIPGDASSRKYFRISSDGDTTILMITKPFEYDADKQSGYQFLEVHAYLSELKIDVPKIFDYDGKQGTILLEDLGDQTLLHRMNSVSDTDLEIEIYQKAIALLVNFQASIKNSKLERKIKAFNLSFDFKKLYWEVGYTVEHFYEKYLDRKFKFKDKKVIEKGFQSICQTLADEPRVFCHRDFHSRNIMVMSENVERWSMIDFQDARMGPAQYDLVSLLRDSYYQLSDSQVEILIKDYISKYEKATKTKIDKHRFVYVFDMMTIQRNFKAIGSFASFLNRRGDARYLKFIGNTFENIRRVLLKYPDLSELREVLFYYYYF